MAFERALRTQFLNYLQARSLKDFRQNATIPNAKEKDGLNAVFFMPLFYVLPNEKVKKALRPLWHVFERAAKYLKNLEQKLIFSKF